MESKKKTAALAAVIQYLCSEEEARRVSEPLCAPVSTLWAQAGRQATMQLRTLMQMKAFHGMRLR